MGLYGQEAKVNHLLSLPQRAPSLSSANAACKHLIEIRRSPGEIAQGQSETGGESEREKGDTHHGSVGVAWQDVYMVQASAQ